MWSVTIYLDILCGLMGTWEYQANRHTKQTQTHLHTSLHAAYRCLFSLEGLSKLGGFLLLVWQLLSLTHERQTGSFITPFLSANVRVHLCACSACVFVCVIVFSAGWSVDSSQTEDLPDSKNKTSIPNNTACLYLLLFHQTQRINPYTQSSPTQCWCKNIVPNIVAWLNFFFTCFSEQDGRLKACL